MRAIASNLITYFLLVTTVLITTGCSKLNNDIIPDVFVEFTILFSDPEFPTIGAASNSVLINAHTNNWGTSASGYDGNGIIVFNTGDEFKAFDRTCPYCFDISSLSIAVNLEEEGGFYAVCPECKTQYLLYYGSPTSGPGNFYLKTYHTSYTNYSVRVWNR